MIPVNRWNLSLFKPALPIQAVDNSEEGIVDTEPKTPSFTLPDPNPNLPTITIRTKYSVSLFFYRGQIPIQNLVSGLNRRFIHYVQNSQTELAEQAGVNRSSMASSNPIGLLFYLTAPPIALILFAIQEGSIDSKSLAAWTLIWTSPLGIKVSASSSHLNELTSFGPQLKW